MLKWSSLENELREGKVKISMIKYDKVVKTSKYVQNKKKILLLFLFYDTVSNQNTRQALISWVRFGCFFN